MVYVRIDKFINFVILVNINKLCKQQRREHVRRLLKYKTGIRIVGK